MFRDLGNGVILGDQKVVFKDAVNWAIEYLRKDDRVVWYLSMVQRLALIENRSNPLFHSPKWRKKVKRKLDGWSGGRVMDDFNLFTQQVWEHFYGVQEVYSHPSMKDYPFYDLIEGKSVPRMASQILNDFRKMEIRLLDDSRLERFCTDGALLYSFANGWAWYKIVEGRSKQEGIAMHHCGNEGGKRGDVLYSLRESVVHASGTQLKPHLTFIVNNGLIGEAKGFANQKPDTCFSDYIEEFLKLKEIRGIVGGGYMPENNFQFFDLPKSHRLRVLDKKPDFRFDPVGEGGNSMLRVSDNQNWRHFGVADCGKQVMVTVGELGQQEPQWLALQEDLEIQDRVRSNSLAWCSYRDGKIGRLCVMDKWLDPDSISSLLENEKVHVIDEPLFTQKSTWDQFLDMEQLENYAVQKPGFFRKTPLPEVFDRLGCSRGFLSVANDQFGLSMKPLDGGIELISFSSLQSFARRTGIGSLISQTKNLAARSVISTGDVFRLKWLTLHFRECPLKPVFLKINWDYLFHLFNTLGFIGKVTPKQLIQEIIIRFGPPELLPAIKRHAV
ncbi:MAG: hypothetical protein HOI70_04960 [Opitutae bacterium]|nr:hypothetical protein [Opitutae bacterium]